NDSSSVMLAHVHASKSTRGEVPDRFFADQLAQLDATNPQMMTAARSRPVAASVGALVMRKMRSSGGAAATVTRGEVVEWLFKDNQPIIGQTVDLIIHERVVAAAAKSRNIALTEPELKSRLREAIDSAKNGLHQIGSSDAPFLA